MGIAALPDGRLLITEKPGRLRIFANDALSDPLEGVPKTTYRERKAEQGGLLDVVVDPGFAQNRRLYLSYSEAAATQAPEQQDTNDPRFGGFLDLTDNVLAGGAVARATLDGNRLTDVQVIWRQTPKTIGRGHFGHRMVFGPGGSLFISSGDRMRFDPAQDASASLGKIERGANYGWPLVSNGDNYDKSPIPDHPTRSEFKAPIKSWTPVISPSGALFYRGSLFPWRGDLIAGGLSSQALIRLTIEGSAVKSEQRVNVGHRVRDVLEASDGALLLITDEKDGALLRLTPSGATEKK